MPDRPSNKAVAAAAVLYELVVGEQTTMASVSADPEIDDPNEFSVNCRAGEFKRRIAEALDAFCDRALTQALEQIVRPHLVGEIEHDCAVEISKDLNDWLQRLRDGTACESCGGTGVCKDCNGFGCVTCDVEGNQFSECRPCKGSGGRQGG